MANAVVLLVVCGYLAWAGFNRLRSPGDVEVDAGLLIAFAAVGLLANAVSLVILRRSDTGSLNLRGAALEVTADLVGSALALGAGVVIALTGWVQADAVASLLIALLILPRSWSLLKESSAVLLEIAPAGLDLDDVRRHVAAMPGVIEVHDLHAWTITSGIPSLSAHVTVTDEALAEHGVGGILDRLVRVRRHPLRRPARDVPGRAGLAPLPRGPRRPARLGQVREDQLVPEVLVAGAEEAVVAHPVDLELGRAVALADLVGVAKRSWRSAMLAWLISASSVNEARSSAVVTSANRSSAWGTSTPR